MLDADCEGVFSLFHTQVLPEITLAPGRTSAQSNYSRKEILHIRHHSLFTPRDFDLSPYFSIIKPTLEKGFDHKKIVLGGSLLLELKMIIPEKTISIASSEDSVD